MTNHVPLRMRPAVQLDKIFEWAVVQSWNDLMPNQSTGKIHVEYHAGTNGSLDYLTIWSSVLRGQWLLICDLWSKPLWSHAIGLHFFNEYHSDFLSQVLEYLMRNDGSFTKLPIQNGLIQIDPPTAAERNETALWRVEMINSQLTLPVIASAAA